VILAGVGVSEPPSPAQPLLPLATPRSARRREAVRDHCDDDGVAISAPFIGYGCRSPGCMLIVGWRGC
jgi:hypothetical protein